MAETNMAQDAGKAGAFTLQQLAGSKRYRGKADLLNALLDPDKAYTTEEADAAINNYRKGKVS